MKQALLALIAGTVLCGVAAAYSLAAKAGTPRENAATR